jgi:hypothetical protein
MLHRVEEAEQLLNELSPWLSAAIGEPGTCKEFAEICERVLKFVWRIEPLRLLTTEQLEKRLENNKSILPDLVGTLYPSILMDEILKIELILSERKQ